MPLGWRRHGHIVESISKIERSVKEVFRTFSAKLRVGPVLFRSKLATGSVQQMILSKSQLSPKSLDVMSTFMREHGDHALRYAVISGVPQRSAKRTVTHLFMRWWSTMSPSCTLTPEALYRELTQLCLSQTLTRDKPRHSVTDNDVLDALWTLPRSVRQGWCLWTWYGWSAPQLALILDTTSGNVESMIHRARHQFLDMQGALAPSVSHDYM